MTELENQLLKSLEKLATQYETDMKDLSDRVEVLTLQSNGLTGQVNALTERVNVLIDAYNTLAGIWREGANS